MLLETDMAGTVRRARLLLGLTQAQFAEKFNVDTCTVSRWERGLIAPCPKIWREMACIAETELGHLYWPDAIKISPFYKYLSPIDDILNPVAISRPVVVGVRGDFKKSVAGTRSSQRFDLSGIRALDVIGAHPQWIAGGVAYAEGYCLAVFIGKWIHLVVTPLPGSKFCLIEYAPCPAAEHEGFKVDFAYRANASA